MALRSPFQIVSSVQTRLFKAFLHSSFVVVFKQNSDRLGTVKPYASILFAGMPRAWYWRISDMLIDFPLVCFLPIVSHIMLDTHGCLGSLFDSPPLLTIPFFVIYHGAFLFYITYTPAKCMVIGSPTYLSHPYAIRCT